VVDLHQKQREQVGLGTDGEEDSTKREQRMLPSSKENMVLGNGRGKIIAGWRWLGRGVCGAGLQHSLEHRSTAR
jgi:hypothetical protein